jgi:hypothetical protein
MRHAATILAILLCCGAMPTSSWSADTPPQTGNAPLAERLKTGLRVQLPGDEAFCDRVATLVATGRLPVKLVDATYIWSLQRAKKYPFPAFQQALRLKAAKLGIRI